MIRARIGKKKKKKVYAVGENDKEDQNRLHKKPNEMSFRVPTFHFQHDGGKNTVIIQSGVKRRRRAPSEFDSKVW